MSDDYLILVPRNAIHVHTREVHTRVVEILERIAPKAEDSSAQKSEKIQFIDCGENFNQVSCPLCSRELNFDWWHERMDLDKVGDGFQLNAFSLPCCGGTATLNELKYDWPQAFGRLGGKS